MLNKITVNVEGFDTLTISVCNEGCVTLEKFNKPKKEAVESSHSLITPYVFKEFDAKSDINDYLSRADMRKLLGCSDTKVDKVLHSSGIKHKKFPGVRSYMYKKNKVMPIINKILDSQITLV